MVSVLIPVYNQYTELDLVLKALSTQTYNEHFEVIVVDDKSKVIDEEIIEKHSNDKKFSLHFYRNEFNSGRSVTRNKAINYANGDILIFSDADRIPSNQFIEDHIECLKRNKNAISIGTVKETYSNAEIVSNLSYNEMVSRKAIYYKLISKIFDKNGKTDSCLGFLTFLVGNLAIEKSVLRNELFDEAFLKWGFEHFELGYRLIENYGLSVILNQGAESIHVAHPRDEMDYLSCIMDSHKIFLDKHPTEVIKNMIKFMQGKISLQEYEILCSGEKKWMQNKKELYNKVFTI